ncbi:ATP-dependent DNA ligase [Streptomyces sp. NBC_00691]|uniref:ATP-dependent DNA ligase n=1 Tax=Streptomyces sp. NBC_00691 TaxID=2903671 RepID=UPI002E3096E4|nr:DNA ligase [Streptomyces sp. NBC_00691]
MNEAGAHARGAGDDAASAGGGARGGHGGTPGKAPDRTAGRVPGRTPGKAPDRTAGRVPGRTPAADGTPGHGRASPRASARAGITTAAGDEARTGPHDLALLPPVDVMRPRAADEIPAQGEPPRELQYSLKLDGFRALAFVLGDGKVVLQSRSRRDLAPEFPGIAAHLRDRLPPGIVLDGELCAYREGRLSFTDLLRSPADRARAGVPVSYIAFDLLAVPGRDVRALPLRDRWELLGTALLDAEPPLQRVLATRDEETARGWFRDLRDAGVEGIVAKSLASTYRAGSTWAWRKIRHTETSDGVLLGVAGPPDRPRALVVRLADGRTVSTSPRLTPAQSREVGALAGDRAGPLVQDPEHGPVRWIDPPLPVELRQLAVRQRQETATFVRVRSEG